MALVVKASQERKFLQNETVSLKKNQKKHVCKLNFIDGQVFFLYNDDDVQ
jgi:hypothetical protein